MGMGTGSENILGSSPGCDDIQIDPADDAHLAAMVQDAGIFVSQDGGASWEARNRGLRSEFLDREGGEAGYDAHSFQMHPLDTERMYAQHHSGVYASRDGGRQWAEISEGLSAALGHPELTDLHGFASAVDPHDPETCYVVPQQSDQARVPVVGKFRVYRTRDGGGSWEALGTGLPDRFYQGVYRQALAHNNHPTPGKLGLYLGTNGGSAFASNDAGESWREVAGFLAPVTSVRCSWVG